MAGLSIKVDRTAYPAYVILAGIPILVLGVYAALFRRQELNRRSLLTVPLLGICFAAYHMLGQLVHQFGHALAARATGHPMSGVRYEYGFSYSEYPPDEPQLPDSVHIQRSFGGIGGGTLMLLFGVFLWLRRNLATHWFSRWLIAFLLLDSVLVFLGSSLSDGVLFMRELAAKAREPEQE